MDNICKNLNNGNNSMDNNMDKSRMDNNQLY